MEDIVEEDMNINRKMSIYKHIKKKAANDAQLLMNRIALIQKEEERARKKIQETKERAAEIIALRYENERRVEAYTSAVTENKKLQQVLLAKNREQDTEGKKAREQRFQMLQNRRREEVTEMVMEKKYLTQLMIQEQEREIQLKQKRREDVRRMEEEIKMKREMERREKERKMKEAYAKKLEAEAVEAKRAEKLVKALEKKEREWIEKLKAAQITQDTAFEQLERALQTHVPTGGSPSGGPRSSISRSSFGPETAPGSHMRSSAEASSSMLSSGSRGQSKSPNQSALQHFAGDARGAGGNPVAAPQSFESFPAAGPEASTSLAELSQGVSQLTLSTDRPSVSSSAQHSQGSGLPPVVNTAAESQKRQRDKSAGKSRPRSAGRSQQRSIK